MLIIKTPYQYISQPALLPEAGLHIAQYGKRVIVAGSRSAFKAAGELLIQSLSDHGITYETYLFEGYPSERIFSEIQTKAAAFEAQAIIGLGGGRVLDAVKVAGDRERLPVITIPTIAATCAAWAAVTIVYDDEGAYTGAIPNQDSPVLVLVDHTVIAAAPARFIKAGVMDTLAKLYEMSPNLSFNRDNLILQQSVQTARLAYDNLTGQMNAILEDLSKDQTTAVVGNAIDAIIYLAGLVGSIVDGFYGGLAHSFYNAVTRIPGTRSWLHGEKVAFGLLVQFVLEGKSVEWIEQELRLFKKLEQPLTLSGLGFDKRDEAALDQVALELEEFIPFVPFLSREGISSIKSAILEADAIGRKSLWEKGGQQ